MLSTQETRGRTVMFFNFFKAAFISSKLCLQADVWYRSILYI